MCAGGDQGTGGSDAKKGKASYYDPPPEAKIGFKSPTFESITGMTETQIIAQNKKAGPTKVARPTTAQVRDMAITELRERERSELTGIAKYSPMAQIGKAIARKSLQAQIRALKAGATPVQISADSGKTITVGTIDAQGRYTGRSEYADFARSKVKSTDQFSTLAGIRASVRDTFGQPGDSDGPEYVSDVPEPKKPEPEPVEEVTQMGSGTLTTKRRRGSGRRTAFGTRQSLVNLKNV